MSGAPDECIHFPAQLNSEIQNSVVELVRSSHQLVDRYIVSNLGHLSRHVSALLDCWKVPFGFEHCGQHLQAQGQLTVAKTVLSCDDHLWLLLSCLWDVDLDCTGADTRH